jgi:hypothetical protein
MRKPPEKGLYISAKDPSIRIYVEDVNVVEDDEEEDLNGFFLVSIVDEDGIDDMGAPGQELDPDQWFELVEEYALKRTS